MKQSFVSADTTGYYKRILRPLADHQSHRTGQERVSGTLRGTAAPSPLPHSSNGRLSRRTLIHDFLPIRRIKVKGTREQLVSVVFVRGVGPITTLPVLKHSHFCLVLTCWADQGREHVASQQDQRTACIQSMLRGT